MDEEGLINHPPMVLTVKTPVDIIGRENMEIFVTHLSVCYSRTNGGEFPHKRLNSEVGPGNRQRITETLHELRDHGFIPVGVDKGRVKWRIVVKSECQQLFEDGLDELQGKTMEELANIARNGYRQIIKQNQVETPPHYTEEQRDAIMYGDGV